MPDEPTAPDSGGMNDLPAENGPAEDRSREDRPTDCTTTRMWLSLKIDDEDLSAGAESRLEDHLAECASCCRWGREESARTAELRSLLGAHESVDTLEAAVVLAARRGGIDEDTLVSRRRGRIITVDSWRGAVVLASAAALLFGLGVLTYSRWDPNGELARGTEIGAGVAPVVGWPGAESPSGSPPGDELLAPTVDGVRVVPGLDGQPIGIRVHRATVAYDLEPAQAEDEAARRVEPLPADESVLGKEGRTLRLEVERVEPEFIRLGAWPYE